MTILVTGATGKIGAEVAALLRARGLPIRAASRSTEPSLDWRSPGTWEAALAGVDTVFLALPGGDDGHRRVDDEVASGVAFVHAAAAAKVDRVVMLSALGMEHAPDEVPLRAVELAVEGHLPAWTILRPNWFFQNLTTGPLHDLAVASGGRLAVPVGDAPISLVDAVDVAEVAVAALGGGHDGQAYDVTGPEAVTMEDVVETIRSGAGATWSFDPVDAERFRAEATGLGWDPGYVDTLCELFAAIRAGWAAEVTDTVSSVLGRPARSLEPFVAGNAQALRAAGSTVPR